MQKDDRQFAILELIAAQPISRQEELAALLEERGFSVTQSSISRDLLELGIVKQNGSYALSSKSKAALDFGLNALETAGENLIVAKCDAGLASAICVRIDAAEIAEIVGTIAGEDSIFIAVKNVEAQAAAIKRIWEIFES